MTDYFYDWKEAELNFIRQNAPHMTDKELSLQLSQLFRRNVSLWKIKEVRNELLIAKPRGKKSEKPRTDKQREGMIESRILKLAEKMALQSARALKKRNGLALLPEVSPEKFMGVARRTILNNRKKRGWDKTGESPSSPAQE